MRRVAQTKSIEIDWHLPRVVISMKKKRGGPPMRVNNTGRIVFNQEAAERIVDQPKYAHMMIHGHTVRLVLTDQASDDSLEMTYPRGPYTSDATRYLEPLGFEKGTGKRSYPIYPEPCGDNCFEFRFPPEKAHHL
jgi:hypothetical protein